jgi:predicted TPR repeat methyltransferase
VELPTVVQRTLGELKGKRVLHLLCGTGETTAALAELGAVVTGLDPRLPPLESARERWPKILWVDGDPQSLPRQLRRGRFDLVYSGEGVLGRLDDLDGWAVGVAAALHAHGELLVFDDHPVADCVDGLLHWRHDYFRDPSDPDKLWRMGQVVSALARAGLHVEALEEYPGGTSRRRHDRRIPATFLLYARRAT